MLKNNIITEINAFILFFFNNYPPPYLLLLFFSYFNNFKNIKNSAYKQHQNARIMKKGRLRGI